jgi:hypothetical protein
MKYRACLVDAVQCALQGEFNQPADRMMAAPLEKLQ